MNIRDDRNKAKKITRRFCRSFDAATKKSRCLFIPSSFSDLEVSNVKNAIKNRIDFHLNSLVSITKKNGERWSELPENLKLVIKKHQNFIEDLIDYYRSGLASIIDDNNFSTIKAIHDYRRRNGFFEDENQKEKMALSLAEREERAHNLEEEIKEYIYKNTNYLLLPDSYRYFLKGYLGEYPDESLLKQCGIKI